MGKIAFVFAGQGSQYSGMGQSLCNASPRAKEVFDIADKLRPGTSQQCFGAAIEELSQTLNTQPCLFCVDLAAAAALSEKGIKADMAAGFSLGEIPALAFCNVLSTEEAFKLVCRRAELMQDAAQAKPGAMAAVLKLSFEDVEELCKGFSKVYPVNYNCPGQLVVAGDKEELGEFCQAVSAKKGRAKMLNVSGAFHSPFMEPAAKGLAEALKECRLMPPSIPLYANTTAEPYGDNAAQLLEKQLMSPVRWQQSIEAMVRDGADTFIELGAGKTLCGLISKICPQAKIFNVQDAESLEATISALNA